MKVEIQITNEFELRIYNLFKAITDHVTESEYAEVEKYNSRIPTFWDKVFNITYPVATLDNIRKLYGYDYRDYWSAFYPMGKYNYDIVFNLYNLIVKYGDTISKVTLTQDECDRIVRLEKYYKLGDTNDN